jgi:hypothetical protein
MYLRSDKKHFKLFNVSSEAHKSHIKIIRTSRSRKCPSQLHLFFIFEIRNYFQKLFIYLFNKHTAVYHLREILVGNK